MKIIMINHFKRQMESA